MQQQVVETTRYLVLAPVQFVVFVVRLPFVVLSLICSKVKQVVCAVFSVPIAFICNAIERAQSLWCSVRCLPRPCGHGPPCIAAAAATAADVDLSAVPHTLPTLGLKEGRQRVDLSVRSATKRRPAIWKASLNLDVTDPERLGQSRINLGKPTREVLLSYLVKLLLQPTTPSDTDEDDDEEGGQPIFRTASPIDLKDPESEKALNLILDLLRLSQSYVYADHHKHKGKHGKQKPSLKKSLQHQSHEVQDAAAPQVSSDEDSSSSQDQASSRCDSPADKPLSNDEEENEPTPAPKRHSLIDTIPILSPLNESPEHSGGSTSSLVENNPQQPPIDSAGHEEAPTTKSELGADQSASPKVKESPTGGKSSPKHKSEAAGVQDTTHGAQTSEQSSSVPNPSEQYSTIVRTSSAGLLTSANESGFDSIPRLSPALGLKEGHDRRDLAGGLRRRPPSKGSAPSDMDPAATASSDIKPLHAAESPATAKFASPGQVSPAHVLGAKRSFAFTPNDQPPWMELIQRRKRSDSGSATGTEESPVSQTQIHPEPQTAPQPEAQSSSDGIYDTLQTVHVKPASPAVLVHPRTSAATGHRYLHESFGADTGHVHKESHASPALPPRRDKGIGLFRTRSGSTSSAPDTESVAKSDSDEKPRPGSGEHKWKLIGGSQKEKKERGERATSPKASKKGKTKKTSSGASPTLHPASSQLSVSSVPGGNDALVLTNPISRQSKEWEKSQSTSRLDINRKSQ